MLLVPDPHLSGEDVQDSAENGLRVIVAHHEEREVLSAAPPTPIPRMYR